MAVVTINLTPSAFNYASSAYGSTGWSSSPSNIGVVLSPGFGSAWAVYKLQATGFPAGETLNAIKIQGTHDFLVGGGSGTGRTATGYWRIGSSIASFSSAPGDGTVGPAINGSGIGQTINADLSKAGFTSTDLLNGTIFLGFAVQTDNGDSAMGLATYRTSAFNTTSYTGSNVPSPPPTATVGVLTNPTANTNPGKLAGQQFSPLDFTFTQPIPQANIQFRWTLPAPMTWATSGGVLLVQSRGTSGNPSDPYHGTSELININATTPGTYSVECFCSGALITDLKLYGSLVVLGAGVGGGFGFHEF